MTKNIIFKVSFKIVPNLWRYSLVRAFVSDVAAITVKSIVVLAVVLIAAAVVVVVFAVAAAQT